MLTIYAISLALIGLSGFMLDLHRRSWRAAEQDESLSDHERRDLQSQYRRRMQASGIIGLLGAAIGIGRWCRASLGRWCSICCFSPGRAFHHVAGGNRCVVHAAELRPAAK